ncbi:MAG: hypothetical protein DMF56_22610 [Acidobacteria bacterium]|nr:MAG: hypothetical protein DMF56_22610 [Acidobacteriota bacterium]
MGKRSLNEQWNPAVLTTAEPPNRRFAVICLVVYCAVTLFVALHHEPWRDEADAWLVVRDMPLRNMIPHWTSNAGTPALWYLLLKPLALAGLPYMSEELLHVTLACIAAAVFLWRAPFTRLTKILLLASYPILYEYAIVARSYVLTVLLLWIAAALHRERERRPLLYALAIALLFNTNVHGAVIAATLVLLYILQSRRDWRALLIMVFGAALALWQLWPRLDAAYPQVVREYRPKAVFWAITGMYLPDQFLDDWTITVFVPQWTTTLWLALSIGLLTFLLITLRKHRDSLVLLLVPYVALLCLFVAVWYGGARHAGLLLVLIIATLWIAGPLPRTQESAATAGFLNIALAASAFAGGIPMTVVDILEPMTMSRAIAEDLIANDLVQFPIACDAPYACEAILPYLDKKQFFYPAISRDGTYMTWDRSEWKAQDPGLRTIFARIRARFGPQGWILITNETVGDPAPWGLRLWYKADEPARYLDEHYWLYTPVRSK